MKVSDDMGSRLNLNGRLRQAGLAAVQVQDAAYSHKLYRLDILLGSTSGTPEHLGVDIPCGASRQGIALALRALAAELERR